jgi:hypothetical protein
MELQKTGNTIAFTIKSPDGETLYSSGGFTIGNDE